jgi:hypothetical protein
VPYVAVAAAAVIGVAAVRHAGPFASGGGSAPVTNSANLPQVHTGKSLQSSAPAPAPASSTSTSVELVSKNYNPGDCVTWEQMPSDDVRPTLVVPCAQSHLIEIVSRAVVPASVSKFPDEVGWDNLAKVLCAQPVRSYLGYALDPDGRFGINSINPLLDAWQQGDRTMWCGIEVTVPLGDPAAPFTGAVRGQSQQLLYPVGTCLNFAADGGGSSPVACTLPHTDEVVGNASLTSLSQLPQGSAYTDALQPQCAALAAQYAGGSLPSGTRWGVLVLTQSNWAAGDRVAQCLIETINGAGTPTQATGSLQR